MLNWLHSLNAAIEDLDWTGVVNDRGIEFYRQSLVRSNLRLALVMLKIFWRTMLCCVVLIAFTSKSAFSQAVATPRSGESENPVDTPICYAQLANGQLIDLHAWCGRSTLAGPLNVQASPNQGLLPGTVNAVSRQTGSPIVAPFANSQRPTSPLSIQEDDNSSRD